VSWHAGRPDELPGPPSPD